MGASFPPKIPVKSLTRLKESSTPALHNIHSVLKTKQSTTNQDGTHLMHQQTCRLEILMTPAPSPGGMLQPRIPKVFTSGDDSTSLQSIVREVTWQNWVTTKKARRKLFLT